MHKCKDRPERGGGKRRAKKRNSQLGMFYFRDDISRSLFLGVYRAPTSVNFRLLFSKDVLRKLFLFRPKLILSDEERKIEIRNRPCGKRTGHATRIQRERGCSDRRGSSNICAGMSAVRKRWKNIPRKRRKREERGETYGTFY